MSERATCWSVTINNPTKETDGILDAARQKGWKVEGQLEKGASGTPHYQLMVSTPQVRWSAMKKAFPGAHIDVARNRDALAAYCRKEQTREGELPKANSLYPNQDQVFTYFVQYLREKGRANPVIDDEGMRIRLDGEQWLVIFDNWVDTVAIPKMRLRIETMAVNPATRSAVKKFMNGIYGRHVGELVEAQYSADRQTDRQAELISQHVTIPTHAPPKEDNESSSSSVGEEQGSAQDSDDFSSQQESDDGTEDGSEASSQSD